MILANAFPKHGTNLVKKVLGGLGLEQVEGQLLRMQPHHRLRVVKGHVDPGYALSLDDHHFMHAHVAMPYEVRSVDRQLARQVLIVRNPRNAVVSFFRWCEKKYPEFRGDHYTFAQLLTQGAYEYGPWVQAQRSVTEWRGVSAVCVVRFEEICTDGGVSVERIADYLGWANVAESVARVYDGLYGNYNEIEGQAVTIDKSTWSEEWSDWTKVDWWDEKLWQAAGGADLERELGYRNI